MQANVPHGGVRHLPLTLLLRHSAKAVALLLLLLLLARTPRAGSLTLRETRSRRAIAQSRLTSFA